MNSPELLTRSPEDTVMFAGSSALAVPGQASRPCASSTGVPEAGTNHTPVSLVPAVMPGPVM